MQNNRSKTIIKEKENGIKNKLGLFLHKKQENNAQYIAAKL